MRCVRLLAGDERPALRAELVEPVGVLHEHAAGDLPELGRARARSPPGSCRMRRFFFVCSSSSASGSKPGAISTSVKMPFTRLGHREGHRAVGGDHAAVRRDRVALVRLAMRLGDVVGDGDPARVRVLDDRDGRLGEVVGAAQGGIRIDVVVVRHLLAAELGRLGDAAARRVGVERRGLVRVLAVAEGLLQLGAHLEALGERRRCDGASPANQAATAPS